MIRQFSISLVLLLAILGGQLQASYTISTLLSNYDNGNESPFGITIDSSNNLYFSNGDGQIFKVSSNGSLSTYASGLNSPAGLTFDSTGNLYVACQGNSVQKIDTSRNVTTIAGNGTQGFSGDGGTATSANTIF